MFKFSKRVFVAMMATVIIASTILPGISFAENTEETKLSRIIVRKELHKQLAMEW